MFVPVRMFNDYVLNNTTTTLHSAASNIAVVKSIVMTNLLFEGDVHVVITLEKVSAPTTEFVRVYNGSVEHNGLVVENMDLAMRIGDRLIIKATGYTSSNVFNVIVGGVVDA